LSLCQEFSMPAYSQVEYCSSIVAVFTETTILHSYLQKRMCRARYLMVRDFIADVFQHILYKQNERNTSAPETNYVLIVRSILNGNVWVKYRLRTVFDGKKTQPLQTGLPVSALNTSR